MYEIDFYENSKGISEVKEFIKELREKSLTNKNARIHFNKMVAYIGLKKQKER